MIQREDRMAIVGRVTEVWRYPVKSMAGERLMRAPVGPHGIVGDRGWALRDEKAGEIRGAKKLPSLLHCGARYLDEPIHGRITPAEITLPDGMRVRSDDPGVSARLSELVGRPVTLWPLQPETARDHYRRALPDNPDLLAELREIFGRTEDEPLPDLTVFPRELTEFASPPGTYFDAFPLHLLTTASLAAAAARTPLSRFDVRRFRPNLLIEPTAGFSGLVENNWCGKTLRLGEVRLKVEMPCVRCVMPTLPQADLPEDPAVLRTIVRDAGQNLGVYATVVAAGAVATGDPVEI
jgi:MOSC domain-containing protein